MRKKSGANWHPVIGIPTYCPFINSCSRSITMTWLDRKKESKEQSIITLFIDFNDSYISKKPQLYHQVEISFTFPCTFSEKKYWCALLRNILFKTIYEILFSYCRHNFHITVETICIINLQYTNLSQLEIHPSPVKFNQKSACSDKRSCLKMYTWPFPPRIIFIQQFTGDWMMANSSPNQFT